ncbi:MAG: hypothetical protein KDK30_17940 [Leptospiraceae bacterium]|nr:hypothetical protein [Leptospiraceae bacterium]MCB1319658.1 hypothetical protein [Leptospiraceae bacterium]
MARRARGRGWEYTRAKQEFWRRMADNPDMPKHVRGWLKQELKRIKDGKRKRIRVPRGYDTGHKVPRVAGGKDTPDNFHAEHSDMNRRRGPKERRFWRNRRIRELIDRLKRIKK